MADVAKDLRAYLLANGTIASLVGQRIYTDALPQSASMPAVVMYKRYGTHEHQLSGLVGLAQSNIQFECYAKTRSEANQIANAIKNSGVMAYKGVYDEVDIRGAKMSQGEVNDVVTPYDGSDERYYLTLIELEVDFLET